MPRRRGGVRAAAHPYIGVAPAVLHPVVANHPLALASPHSAQALSDAVSTSIEPGTLASYASQVKSYVTWCGVRNLHPWPCDEVLLAGWLIHLGSSVAVNSLPGYASAVKFMHPLNCSTPWPCDGSVLVKQAFRSLKREYGMAKKGSKYTICMATLRRLLPLLAGWPDPSDMAHDDIVFACASLIATCAFLRGGEFTTHTKASRSILLGRDVRVCDRLGPKAVAVSIPKPKNAWWLQSVDADEPAFQTAEGKAVTRDFMVHRTCALLDLAGIFDVDDAGERIKVKASSWRAGGARSATNAGLPGPLIMALGRWRSIAWGAYVAYSVSDLESAAQQMWRVSGAAAPEASLRVGVPVPFQDDDIDIVSLRGQIELRSISHRRAGPAPARVSASRQCG